MRLLRGTSSDTLPLALACVVLAAVLATMTTGGPFTSDEAHYLATITALRSGTFHLESTASLLPSRELLAFGAHDFFDGVPSTPVAPVAPPLYAFLALPFASFGFRALVWLNTASFIATGVMVFHFAKRNAARRVTAWLALALYWFASFSLEYAVGLWPYCIAVMLCTGAVLLVHRASERGSALLAACAGMLTGIASGVRYQEAIYGALLGLTLLYWSLFPTLGVKAPPRTRTKRLTDALGLGTAYGVGAAGPLFVSAYVNHLRLGIWAPFTKGVGYTEVGRSRLESSPRPVEWLWTCAMKVVDFSLSPPIVHVGDGDEYRPSALSSSVVYGGVVKKAWLQSSPWMLLAFLGLALSWRSTKGLPPRGRQELRGMSLVVFGVIAAFSFAGLGRSDGFSFNMRVFLDLMPLGAVATVWIVQRYFGWKPMLVLSALAGAVPALATFGVAMPRTVHDLIILRAPLVLAALLALAALHARRTNRGRYLAPALAACVGWAVIVHVGDDFLASLKLRARHEYYADVVAPQLDAEKTAIIAYGGATTPLSPLTLKYDLTLVDPFLDSGETARATADDLLAHGFRVLVFPQKMPSAIYNSIVEGKLTREVWADKLVVVELGDVPAPQ